MSKVSKGILPSETNRLEEGYNYILVICNLTNAQVPTLKVITYSQQMSPKEFYDNQSSAKELKLKQYEILNEGWELYDWTERNNIQSFFYKKFMTE